MHHYRKTVHKYRARQRTDQCPFCNPATLDKAVYQDDYVYIVSNLTHYDLWELQDVEDHLLIVPKRHVKSLQELDSNERLAIMDAAAGYETNGYSVYARGVGFVNRSVEHQHTHLIKTKNNRPKFTIFIHKPYLLIRK